MEPRGLTSERRHAELQVASLPFILLGNRPGSTFGYPICYAGCFYIWMSSLQWVGCVGGESSIVGGWFS